MAGPDRSQPANVVDAMKNVFDMTPNGEDGIGPTLGEDVSAEAQRRTDAKSGAKPAPLTEDEDKVGGIGSFDQSGGE